ncbi:MAG: hypothetical protein ABWY27_02980 [Telluria sp.]
MYLMSLLLLSTHFMAASMALAAPPVSIAFAEQPVRLLRDKSFYLAGRGAQFQHGDIVESGSGAVQLDGGGAAILALGPATRLQVRLGPKGSDYLLLAGWLKVQARAATEGGPVTVSSPGARIELAAASVILHAEPGKTALFVESGQPGVEELQPGKRPRRSAIAREQYAVFGTAQPIKVMPRAPREFLGAMPPAFFDALVPVAARGAMTAPKLDRPATFAEIAPWLADQPELRQALYRRFHPPKPRAAAPYSTTAKDPS